MLSFLFGIFGFAGIAGIMGGRSSDVSDGEVRNAGVSSEDAPSLQQPGIVFVDTPVDEPAETSSPAPTAPNVDEDNGQTGEDVGDSEDSQATDPIEEPAGDDPAIEDPAAADEPAAGPTPPPSEPDGSETDEGEDSATDESPDEAPDVSAGQTPSGADENPSQSVTLDASYSGTVTAGRVATIDLGDEAVHGVKVISGPEYGNVTVNPDNTLAVVLTGTTASSDLSFTVQLQQADGSTVDKVVTLDVNESLQADGWGQGHFYMLETDENGDVIVEHGENHRKVHISESDDALSFADIEALEGLSAGTVDGKWLAENPDYGSDPDVALTSEAGLALWAEISSGSAEPNSNWLLFERGHEYDVNSRFINGSQGESELHPQLISAYGTGDDPLITSGLEILRDPAEFIVIQGLDFDGKGIQVLSGSNVIADDLTLTGGAEFTVIAAEGITLRNSEIVDVFYETPVDPDSEVWAASPNRVSAVFAKNVDGLLLEGNFVDMVGWEEGYDPINGSTDYPQPPSYYSQNFYIQKDNLDVTLRDNITMRAASIGAQVRSGGFIENNVFLDNNGALNFFGGPVDEETGVGDGNYTLFADNVITSAAYKESATHQGAYALGLEAGGSLPTLVDNIVAHLANPDDPTELDDKYLSQVGLADRSQDQFFYNDTIIYNWVGGRDVERNDPRQPDTNTEGLDTALLDATTIQRFTAELLGQETATIGDLADYLRAQDDTGALNGYVDADIIIAYFQSSFGLTPDIRAESETVRFVPNDLGDGVRWDNRLNWTTEDLPGTQDGDNVDLAGNWVQYGGTTTIDALNFGEGGLLNVTHGYLEVEGRLAVGDSGADLDIDKSGQVWINGYSDKDALTIDADGGRFANTGLLTGTVDLNVTDNAQVILAGDDADYVMDEGSSITIEGSEAKVGFDGDQGGTAVLLMSEDSELNFVADEEGLSAIREFYSGHFDDSGAGIQSGVNLGGTAINIDVSALAGAASTHTLMSVDELIGDLGGLSITGLGSRDAELQIDYEKDTVTLVLGQSGEGNGAITLEMLGDQNDARDATELWAALTNGHGIYSDDPVEDIPVEEDLLADIF